MENTPQIIEKIAIRDLDGEVKEHIAQSMIDDVETSLEYRSQMFLSIVVATLGLLIDATPVVIGAMLIAPIMRPIQGVAFAIATGNQKLFGKSLRLLLLSIGGGVALGFVLTRLIPLTQVTNEIASRTQPTLVDLGIAFASGLVAFLALGYKKMSAGLAGVAMAASLVPPLGVIGIGIAFGSWSIGWGSTVLFLTNLVAIIIAGIIIFYVFGFSPNQADDLKRSMKNIGFVGIMLALLTIPLGSSLITITKDIRTQNIINRTTAKFLGDIDKKISIESLNYDTQNNTRNISLSIKAPQSVLGSITDTTKEILSKELATQLNRDVALDVSITPVTTVTKQEAKQLSPEQKLRQRTQEYLNVLYEDKVTIISIDYFKDTKRFAVLNLYTEIKISNKQEFEAKIYDYLQDREDLIDIIQIDRIDNYTEPEKVKQQKDQDLELVKESFDTSFAKETHINNLDIIYITDDENPTRRPKILAALNITTTASPDQLSDKMQQRKTQLQEDMGTEVSLEIVVEYLDTLSF